MPRRPREVWSPAKRTIIGEWHYWAKSNLRMSEGDNAFGMFYLHLKSKTPALLAEDHFETVRNWLAEEGLIKIRAQDD